MLAYTTSKSLKVSNWFVVRPRDATKEDDQWLGDLTKGPGIPAKWLGETNIDSWAARHPSVIDYYLHDGRQRAEDVIFRALSAAGLMRDVGAGAIADPFEAVEGLRDLYRTVNEVDPHYRYELHVTRVDDAPLMGLNTVSPELAYSAASEKNGVRVRIDVFTRYDQAIEDSPLNLRAILIPSTKEQQEAVSDFLEYGVRLEGIPVEVSDTNLPLLGDLTETAQVTATVLEGGGGPHAGKYDIRIDAPAGFAPVQSVIEMNTLARGIDGASGRSWSGTLAGGLLSVRFTWHEGAAPVTLRTKCQPIMGRLATDVALAVAAQKFLTTGLGLRISLPGGPVVFQLQSDSKAAAGIQDLNTVSALMALTEIQRVVPARLTLPDDVETLSREAPGWINAAQLLKGKAYSAKWSKLPLTQELNEPIHFPVRIRAYSKAAVVVHGRRHDLGIQLQDGVAGSWRDLPADDGAAVLLPSNDDLIVTTLSSSPETDRAFVGRVFFAPLQGEGSANA